MKKIFYWFLLLCLSFTSCNDENKVVLLTNDSPELTVTSVSPQRGYVGAQVTIEGTDFGADASLISVFFSGVEEAAELVSCEDTKLIVEVPAGATDGAITVKVRDMTVQTDDSFIVVPDPVMESVSPESIYAGTEGHNEIMVTGSNFGTVAEDVVLYLLQGEERIDAVVSACENDKITAIIPEAALFGEFDVKMEIKGREAIGSFKLVLNEKAVITDISTDHVFGTLFAAPGTILTIKGQNFGTNKDVISVKIGELDANVTSVSDTEIKVTIPEGFTSGSAITVAKDGITTTSDKTLNKLEPGTDVSAYALKNYKQPFVADEAFCNEAGVEQPTAANNYGNGTWYIPASWTLNEAAKYITTNGVKGGGLYNNMLCLETGWGKPNVISNGKMYQTTVLAKGKYKLIVTATEYRPKQGTLYLIAVSGSDIPNVDDVTTSSVVLMYNKLTGDNGGGTFEIPLEFSVTTSGEVSLGFVLSFGSTQNFKVTSLKLEYIGETN